MTEQGPPTSERSPNGRRVIVAVVTGEIGERIQVWRERHDPNQASRLPPHTTLCYNASIDPGPALEAQVRHAFPKPVVVRLGGVRQFGNRERTFYVEMLDTGRLDEARVRLFDGTHLELPRPNTMDWPWHITCVRDARKRDRDALRLAARELTIDAQWRIDRLAHLELRGDRYEPIAEFNLR